MEWHLTGQNQNTWRKILSQRHFTHHKSQRAYLCASTMGRLQVTNTAMARFSCEHYNITTYVPFVGFNSVTQRDVRISQIFFISVVESHRNRNVVTNRRNLKDG